MIKIWCEWDVGQDDLIFTDTTAARAWINNNGNIDDIVKDGDFSIDGLFEQGLIGYQSLRLVA